MVFYHGHKKVIKTVPKKKINKLYISFLTDTTEVVRLLNFAWLSWESSVYIVFAWPAWRAELDLQNSCKKHQLWLCAFVTPGQRRARQIHQPCPACLMNSRPVKNPISNWTHTISQTHTQTVTQTPTHTHARTHHHHYYHHRHQTNKETNKKPQINNNNKNNMESV